MQVSSFSPYVETPAPDNAKEEAGSKLTESQVKLLEELSQNPLNFTIDAVELTFNLAEFIEYAKGHFRYPLEDFYLVGSAARYIVMEGKCHYRDLDIAVYLKQDDLAHFGHRKQIFDAWLNTICNFLEEKWSQRCGAKQVASAEFIDKHFSAKMIMKDLKQNPIFSLVGLGDIDIKLIMEAPRSISDIDGFQISLTKSSVRCFFGDQLCEEKMMEQALEHLEQRIIHVPDAESTRRLLLRISLEMTRGFMLADEEIFDVAIRQFHSHEQSCSHVAILTKHYTSHYGSDIVEAMFDFFHLFRALNLSKLKEAKCLEEALVSAFYCYSKEHNEPVAIAIDQLKQKPDLAQNLLFVFSGILLYEAAQKESLLTIESHPYNIKTSLCHFQDQSFYFHLPEISHELMINILESFSALVIEENLQALFKEIGLTSLSFTVDELPKIATCCLNELLQNQASPYEYRGVSAFLQYLKDKKLLPLEFIEKQKLCLQLKTQSRTISECLLFHQLSALLRGYASNTIAEAICKEGHHPMVDAVFDYLFNYSAKTVSNSMLIALKSYFKVLHKERMPEKFNMLCEAYSDLLQKRIEDHIGSVAEAISLLEAFFQSTEKNLLDGPLLQNLMEKNLDQEQIVEYLVQVRSKKLIENFLRHNNHVEKSKLILLLPKLIAVIEDGDIKDNAIKLLIQSFLNVSLQFEKGQCAINETKDLSLYIEALSTIFNEPKAFIDNLQVAIANQKGDLFIAIVYKWVCLINEQMANKFLNRSVELAKNNAFEILNYILEEKQAQKLIYAIDFFAAHQNNFQENIAQQLFFTFFHAYYRKSGDRRWLELMAKLPKQDLAHLLTEMLPIVQNDLTREKVDKGQIALIDTLLLNIKDRELPIDTEWTLIFFKHRLSLRISIIEEALKDLLVTALLNSAPSELSQQLLTFYLLDICQHDQFPFLLSVQFSYEQLSLSEKALDNNNKVVQKLLLLDRRYRKIALDYALKERVAPHLMTQDLVKDFIYKCEDLSKEQSIGLLCYLLEASPTLAPAWLKKFKSSTENPIALITEVETHSCDKEVTKKLVPCLIEITKKIDLPLIDFALSAEPGKFSSQSIKELIQRCADLPVHPEKALQLLKLALVQDPELDWLDQLPLSFELLNALQVVKKDKRPPLLKQLLKLIGRAKIEVEERIAFYLYLKEHYQEVTYSVYLKLVKLIPERSSLIFEIDFTSDEMATATALEDRNEEKRIDYLKLLLQHLGLLRKKLLQSDSNKEIHQIDAIILNVWGNNGEGDQQPLALMEQPNDLIAMPPLLEAVLEAGLIGASERILDALVEYDKRITYQFLEKIYSLKEDLILPLSPELIKLLFKYIEQYLRDDELKNQFEFICLLSHLQIKCENQDLTSLSLLAYDWILECGKAKENELIPKVALQMLPYLAKAPMLPIKALHILYLLIDQEILPIHDLASNDYLAYCKFTFFFNQHLQKMKPITFMTYSHQVGVIDEFLLAIIGKVHRYKNDAEFKRLDCEPQAKIALSSINEYFLRHSAFLTREQYISINDPLIKLETDDEISAEFISLAVSLDCGLKEETKQIIAKKIASLKYNHHCYFCLFKAIIPYALSDVTQLELFIEILKMHPNPNIAKNQFVALHGLYIHFWNLFCKLKPEICKLPSPYNRQKVVEIFSENNASLDILKVIALVTDEEFLTQWIDQFTAEKDRIFRSLLKAANMELLFFAEQANKKRAQ